MRSSEALPLDGWVERAGWTSEEGGEEGVELRDAPRCSARSGRCRQRHESVEEAESEQETRKSGEGASTDERDGQEAEEAANDGPDSVAGARALVDRSSIGEQADEAAPSSRRAQAKRERAEQGSGPSGGETSELPSLFAPRSRTKSR